MGSNHVAIAVSVKQNPKFHHSGFAFTPQQKIYDTLAYILRVSLVLGIENKG